MYLGSFLLEEGWASWMQSSSAARGSILTFCSAGSCFTAGRPIFLILIHCHILRWCWWRVWGGVMIRFYTLDQIFIIDCDAFDIVFGLRAWCVGVDWGFWLPAAAWGCQGWSDESFIICHSWLECMNKGLSQILNLFESQGKVVGNWTIKHAAIIAWQGCGRRCWGRQSWSWAVSAESI